MGLSTLVKPKTPMILVFRYDMTSVNISFLLGISTILMGQLLILMLFMQKDPTLDTISCSQELVSTSDFIGERTRGTAAFSRRRRE
jgi:hypothetical protein